MIIFTVAETSSFVGMTKGFAAAPKTFISDRCAAIRSRGAPTSLLQVKFFFSGPTHLLTILHFKSLGRAVLKHCRSRSEKMFVCLLSLISWVPEGKLIGGNQLGSISNRGLLIGTN